MTVWMEQNKMGAEDLSLDIVVEEDDGVFLSVTIEAGEVADLLLTNPSEIERFFAMVDEAKASWESLRAKADA